MKKSTYESVVALIISKDGTCLSPKHEYQNSKSRITIKCNKDEKEWTTMTTNILRGSWCPRCAGNEKKGIDDIRIIALGKGGICLSQDDEYKGIHGPLKFRCQEGHEWLASKANVKKGTWCPACAGNKPVPISRYKEIANLRGGICLSEQSDLTRGRTSILRFRCHDDHEWNTQCGNIVARNSWCPHCAGNARHTIADAQQLAVLRGGKCTSTGDIILNVQSELEWECSEKHRWISRYINIRDGSWCTVCARKKVGDQRRKHSIRTFQDLAIERGGVCLSEIYQCTRDQLSWRCAKHHQWIARAGSVYDGSWCLRCTQLSFGDRNRTHCIEDAKQLALSRGGRCLSNSFQNVDHKLTWRCDRNHEWDAAMSDVSRGSWCPNCRYKNESACRTIIERLTLTTFPKKRPDWLDGLELDGLNEKLRLAFEYQGEQHYVLVPHFHKKGEQSLREQQERDERKMQLCDDNSITLITIPYWIRDKEEFISGELRDLGYEIDTSNNTLCTELERVNDDISPMTDEEFDAWIERSA